MKTWVAQELRGCRFPDKRLGDRLGKLVGQFSERMGQSIPMACQDWASTKAAYRFFASERVNEALILQGHFDATRERVSATTGPVLVLHDTTEFSYKREADAAIGRTHKVPTGNGGRSRMHTVCGLLMHASLVATTDGLPLGLAAIKFWTRKKFKGTNRLKRKVNLTRIPIERKESVRWLRNLKESSALLGDPSRLVHIGDRESDIYELFCAAQETETHFLVSVDCVATTAARARSTIWCPTSLRGRRLPDALRGAPRRVLAARLRPGGGQVPRRHEGAHPLLCLASQVVALVQRDRGPNEQAETLIRTLARSLRRLWRRAALRRVRSAEDGGAQVEAKDGEVTEWNPVFAYAALEIGFTAEVCWPHAPRQKGSVENLVGWVKGSFFKQRRFRDREDLVDQLEQWHREVNTERASRARASSRVRREEERARLRSAR